MAYAKKTIGDAQVEVWATIEGAYHPETEFEPASYPWAEWTLVRVNDIELPPKFWSLLADHYDSIDAILIKGGNND
jgi:hypothetical protein